MAGLPGFQVEYAAMELLFWLLAAAAGLLFKFWRKGPARQVPLPPAANAREVAERLANSLRVTRVITGAMLGFVLLLALFVARMVKPASAGPPDEVIVLSISMVALLTGIASLAIHKLMVEPAAAALRQRLNDEAARTRWIGGKIVAAATAEAVALSGFVLQVLGLEPGRAAIFYAAGALLLIFHLPRRDALPLEEAERQQALSSAQRAG